MFRRQRASRAGLGSWLRLGRAALVWTLVTVVGVSAVGLVTSDASWLGAQDDRVASVAIETYADFLRRVAWGIAQMALVEWVFLSAVTLGVLQLTTTSRDHRPSKRIRVHVTHFATALLVTLVFWGFGASRHPGLFLGILATSRIAALWVEACRLLAPLVAVASLTGYIAGAAQATKKVQIACIAIAALIGVAGGRARAWAKHYKPDEPFTIATLTPEAEDAPPVLAKPDSGVSPAIASPAKTATKVAGSGARGASSASPPAPPSPGALPPRASNVLWIAVDSLRPDKIDAQNTPNLAALLSESIYFPNTIVPVPRTGPSWTAALTSLEPLTTGIETMFPDKKRADLSTVAMPAYLAARGYRTMVVSEYAGEFFRRVNLGFATEAVPRAELMQISGQIMMSRAPLVLAQTGLLYGAGPAWRSLLPAPMEELIRGLPNFSTPDTLGADVRSFLGKGTEPAFILAFYSQPHFPYTSSPELSRRYRVPGSDPSLAYGRDVTSEAPITSDLDRKQVDALYRAALAESDAAIGKLLDELRKTGWLDDTIVVLTADHGEGLYECVECVGHGDNLRGMVTLRVPLAIRLPAGRFPTAKHSVQQHYVSLLDVYPTITELLGLPRLAIMEGQAILDAAGAVLPPPATPRTLMVETGEWLWTTAAVPKDRIDYPPVTTLARLEGDRISIDPKYEGVIRAAKHRAAIRAPYKLVYEPARAGVRWRLFDFEADPFDTKDLAASHPEVLAELKEALRRSVVRHARVLPVGDWFLTRPPGVPEDHW
jgi:arylsulfatase A-like enzyme